MKRTAALVLAAASIVLTLLPAAIRADDSPAPAHLTPEQIQALVKTLHYQTGEITLKDGLAKIKVPDDFRYLDPDDTQTVLEKVWGNPPSEKTLGMLMPAGVSPEEARSWGVLITYEESGYVKDDDAEKINYDDLLKQLQKNTEANNEERKKGGYPAITLLGWAAAPRYDKDAKKLYWAKELKVEGYDTHTLNYDIRVLGRRGVLVLSAIAAMPQFAEIQEATPKLLSMVDFQQGNRYVDFDPKTDHIAAYGIAALIAGTIAAKVGLFKGLLLALAALWKFVVVGVVAIGAFFKRLITGEKKPRQ